MTEPAALSAWENFYVIVGSSGGALIGLQFVVLTLISEKQQRTNADTLSAFGTPTVVHLVGALVISAAMSVPWPSILFPSAPLAAPFIVAASALGLLLIGIHNAWDTVTHILITAPHHDANKGKHK